MEAVDVEQFLAEADEDFAENSNLDVDVDRLAG